MYRFKPVTVEAKAPDFILQDENGNNVSLRDVNRNGSIVLVFIRDFADARYREELDYLNDDYARFRSLGADVLAITCSSVRENSAFHKRKTLSYHLLSDSDCVVIKRYGLYNEYDKLTGPAVYVLNKAGTVAFMYAGKNPSDIVDDEEIIRALQGDTQTAPDWPMKG